MSNIRNNRRGNPFPLRESLAARRLRYCVIVLAISFSLSARAQEAWTWERVKARFEANNPTLSAGHLTVEEARANEVTANLRPNPQLGIVLDQFPVFNPSILSPNSAQWTPAVTQLIERQSKRHLRYQSAQLATEATQSEALDLERTLIFDLRDAFIRLLAAKSVLQLAQDNLAYYDKVIDVNTERYKAGDVAKIDLQRVELQRAQFQSDYQTAQVSLQQAKLDLLNLMNEKTPAGQFDVLGEFDFHDAIPDLGELRNTALSARPDLQSAQTTAHKAKVDHKLAWANGSTDPTLGLEYQRTQNINTLGIDLQIPLRIFDRNQGEKQRTRSKSTAASACARRCSPVCFMMWIQRTLLCSACWGCLARTGTATFRRRTPYEKPFLFRTRTVELLFSSSSMRNVNTAIRNWPIEI